MSTVHAMYCLIPDLSRTLAMLCQIDDLGLSTETISILVAEDHVNGADRAMIDDNVLASLVGSPTHIEVFTAIGPLLVIGPMQERLRAAAIASPVGGFIGALVRMGVPGPAATCYGGGLRQGRVLLAIHTRTAADREVLDRLIANLGAVTRADTGAEADQS